MYKRQVEAALKNNGYVIGVDVDQNYIGANGVADGTYAYNPFITSAMKGLTEAVNTALADIDAGSWGDIAGSNGNFGLEDGDYIVYKRQKIKRQKGVKPISIKITPAIRQLIESLQAASPTVDDFLLPVVTRSGYTGERLYMHIRTRYSKYQKYLRLLAEELGIDFHLTSYVSRHTAAMTLQRNHIPREVISQMLGHADLETTNVYLDSFDNKVINEAAKVL